jgi:hypothetical protein
VTFCVTASVLPPLNFRELLDSLNEPYTNRVLRRALSSTLGAHPMAFIQNVMLKNKVRAGAGRQFIMRAALVVCRGTGECVCAGKHVRQDRRRPPEFMRGLSA